MPTLHLCGFETSQLILNSILPALIPSSSIHPTLSHTTHPSNRQGDVRVSVVTLAGKPPNCLPSVGCHRSCVQSALSVLLLLCCHGRVSCYDLPDIPSLRLIARHTDPRLEVRHSGQQRQEQSHPLVASIHQRLT